MFEHYYSSQWGKPVVDRLAAMTKRNPETGCLEWTGKPVYNGYGQMKVPDGQGHWRGARPHRVVWELNYGPIPEGKSVCHHCDNRLCVTPEHLFVGTNADNMADRNTKERQARGERQWKAVLTADLVMVIRGAHRAGVHQSTIARGLGLTDTTVSSVVKRRTWKHLP